MSHDHIRVDIDRHHLGVARAREESKLNSYTEVWLAVSGELKVARRVVTRAPRATAMGVYNLPMKDVRVLNQLSAAGFKVQLILWCESNDTVCLVDYNEVMASATRCNGSLGQDDYMQIKGPQA